jgi:beta-N-acetylhexosaminidase
MPGRVPGRVYQGVVTTKAGPKGLAVAAGALSLALAAAGCGGSAPARQHPAASASGGGTSSAAPPAAAASSAVPPARSCQARVLGRLTLPQRVGQLFIVGLPGDRLSQATARTVTGSHFGSVMFITASSAGVTATRAVSRAAQDLASAASGGVGYFVAANQEGGEVQALTGPGFSAIPAAVDQGLLPPGTLRRSAAAWGSQLRAAGVNLDFAPVMDVVPPGTDGLNQPIGVLHREYGHDPATVAAHGVAFLRGMTRAGLATTAKHFPGLGRVRGNTDFSSGVVDTVTTTGDPYLRSFRAAVDAGVPFVMVALATYTRIDPGRLAVFSPAVMRGMLRHRLGFRGVIISDDMGAARAVAGIPAGSRAIRFLAAGGDMITSKYPGPATVMAGAVLARARSDPAFRHLVSVAALRILAAKRAAGLLSC